MGDQLVIYARLVGAKVRSDAQYRTSFVLYLVSQTLVAVGDLLVVFVLFTNTAAIAGWSAAEVVFLYGLTGVAFGLADTFISQVEIAGRHVREGTFDSFLIRPMSPMLQLCAREFAVRRLGRVINPVLALIVVLPRLDVAWDPGRVLLVPVAVISGTVIFGAVWVTASSIVFWTVGGQQVANSFTYGGNYLTQYPVNAFGEWLQRIVIFVVPVAFVSYLPAAWILGKPPVLGLPGWTGLLTPVAAALAALVARTVWRTGVRRYRSTGS